MAGRDPGESELLQWLWCQLYSADGTGSVCVKCGEVRRFHPVRGRRAFACDHCGTHVHPTKGTLLEGSKLRLVVWFRAVWLIVGSGGSVSVRRLAEELAITPRSASRLKRVVVAAQARGGRDADLVQRMYVESPLARGAGDTAMQRPTLSAAPRPAGSRTREKITAAACRVLGERGLAATRVADIAEVAGVSPAIIHYYFKSKDQVLLAALTWASQRQEIWERRILTSETDHMQRLRALVEMAVPKEGVPRDEYRLWLEMYGLARHDPQLLEHCSVLSERWRSFIERVIDEGAADDVFRPVAPAHEIAHRLVNLFDGLGFRLVVGYSATSYESARDVTCRFVAEQVGVPMETLRP